MEQPENEPEKPLPNTETDQTTQMTATATDNEDYTVPTILLDYMNNRVIAEANFLDNCFAYLVQQLKHLIKKKPFQTVKTWFQNNTECTISLNNWGELIKTLAITSLDFPEWEPSPLEGMNVPQLIQQMKSSFTTGVDYELMNKEENDDPELPTGKPLRISQQPLSGSTTSTAKPTAGSSTTDQDTGMTTLLAMMIKMQEKINSMDTAAEKGKGKQTVSQTPHQDTATEPVTQNEINQQLIQALKVLQGEEDKALPPPLRILPKHVCERILKLHDYPSANYKQQAACHSAKALLELYERGVPLGANETDNFNNIAHSLTESIQDALTADAFPSHEKPLMKERKALLHSVLGKQNITATELKEAYNTPAPNYSSRGRGRSNYNFNSNWRGRGRGTGGGRTGRGRGRASSSYTAPENLQPGH